MTYYLVRNFNSSYKWKGTYRLLKRTIDRINIIIKDDLSFADAYYYVQAGYGTNLVVDQTDDFRNYKENRKIRVPSRKV